MKRRLANSLLLMGTGLLILSMLLSTVSLAAPPAAPLDSTRQQPMAGTEWPCASWGCTANDMIVTAARLGKCTSPYQPLDPCNPGETVNACIWITIDNHTGAPRYAPVLLYDLHLDGVPIPSGSVLECVDDTIPSSPAEVDYNIEPLSWVCGSEVDLVNLVLSWNTSATTCTAFLADPACTNRKSQCYGPELIHVAAPLVADFDFSEVCYCTDTQFTDTTTGGVTPYTSWYWDFGDGLGTSDAQHPPYHFGASGTYTVTLTVTDTAQTSDDQSHAVTVRETPAATAPSFSVCPDTPLTDQLFINQGSACSVDSMNLDYSGVNTPTPGDYTYTVSCDSQGCTDQATGTVTVVEVPPDTACTSYTCAAGEVDVTYAPDATTCNADSDGCTLDTCQSGTCVVGGAPDCSAEDDQCNEGVCSSTGPNSYTCVKSPLPDGTTCNDGLFCTDPDTCQEGTCTGPPRDCSDGVDCTVDTCDEANDQCVNTPDDSYCDDENICTDDSCDEQLGCDNVFDVTNAPECEACYGVVCDDGLWCNGLEACDPATGQCVDGTPPDCSDNLFCTVNERCDEAANACVSDPRDCSDDLFCTVNETCDEVSGACRSDLRHCGDEEICTDDSCDEAADICVNEFDETNDPSCVVAPVLSAGGNARCTAWWVDFSSDVTAEYYIRVKLDGHTEFVEKGTFIGSKSFRDDWDLKGSGIRTMRITYWVKAGGDQVGEDEIRTLNCGTPPAGPTPTPVPPTPVPPTPTPIVEVLGVERLPVTGGMAPLPAFPSLRLILSSLTLIGSGLLLRRKE